MNTYARVSVAGATGYAGRELLRLLARHPSASIAAAMGSSPEAPPRPASLARMWDGDLIGFDLDRLADADVAFLALPESAAARIAPALVDAGVRVIDLSGAFRLA